MWIYSVGAENRSLTLSVFLGSNWIQKSIKPHRWAGGLIFSHLSKRCVPFWRISGLTTIFIWLSLDKCLCRPTGKPLPMDVWVWSWSPPWTCVLAMEQWPFQRKAGLVGVKHEGCQLDDARQYIRVDYARILFRHVYFSQFEPTRMMLIFWADFLYMKHSRPFPQKCDLHSCTILHPNLTQTHTWALSKKPWVEDWFWSKRPTFSGVCTILVEKDCWWTVHPEVTSWR